MKLPEVPVALSTIFNILFFKLKKSEEFGPIKGSYLPVPKETTHCTGVSGQSVLHSKSATPLGLLDKIPPS